MSINIMWPTAEYDPLDTPIRGLPFKESFFNVANSEALINLFYNPASNTETNTVSFSSSACKAAVQNV
ncbi:MAG: hypothetical protein DHS20C08_06880 [Rhodomicrobium sp.]|nr:MAG: hypothetical protein DHS20C08_06880 [Rhodomicrobium sp.]